jgi:hypothetical protein
MSSPLGSRTSGVDGSSEGGRISTMRLSQALVLYGIPLVAELRRSGYKGKVDVEPALVDGVPCLKLRCDGERPKHVPRVWHGHRVIVEMLKPKDG